VITPDVPLAGKTLSIIALYVDQLGADGMSNLSFAVNALVVQP
jgi:hypothetical protein